MVFVHEGAEGVRSPRFDGAAGFHGEVADPLEDFVIPVRVGLPAFSHVADGNGGGTGDACISDKEGEGGGVLRTGDGEGFDGVAADEVDGTGVGDDGVVYAGGCAVMVFFDFVGEGVDLLVGEGMTKEGRKRANDGHGDRRARSHAARNGDGGLNREVERRRLRDPARGQDTAQGYGKRMGEG